MADLSKLAVDTDRQSEGVWCTYPGTDVQVRIASISSPAYEQEAAELQRSSKIQRAVSGRLSNREVRNAIAPAVARALVIDWKNITDQGSDVPFTFDRAVEMLRDPQFDDFYTFILDRATNVDLFRKEDEAEALGKSSSGASGETHTALT